MPTQAKDVVVAPPATRVRTGIEGLDAVLKGGLLAGGLYIVQGPPGAGKTIFANHIAFGKVAEGERVVYATLLTESHARMMLHLGSMKFFDKEAVGSGISYVSAFGTLEAGGLKSLLELLRREVRTRKASLLVVDGLVAAQESAESERDFKKFIHELQVHCDLNGTTVLLLTSGPIQQGTRPEHTMVDGTFELGDTVVAGRSERQLEVKKFRGSSFLRGLHPYRISSNGISLFPRIESLLAKPTEADLCRDERVSTGVEALDEMLGGGLPCSTTGLILGSSGVGKTTLGLHFLAASSKDEPGLLFTFYETPPRLLMKAQKLGLDLEPLVKSGALEILWVPPTQRILDELGKQLLDAVERRGVTRLFVDGLQGFTESAVHTERISHYFTAVCNELRVRGVTTLVSSEVPQLVGREISAPLGSGISSIAENILLMRFVELHAHLYRMLSIVKVRDSGYDSSLREFKISEKGIQLERTFQSAQEILSGMPHEARHATRRGKAAASASRRRRR